MYHLYAGVAGLIQFTPVGDFLVTLVQARFSREYSFPLLTALISTVVAIFIPTSGGQWLIQGFVTVETAALVGCQPQRGLLALSVGDHMGNLITPFWAVVGASIAQIDFRLYFGYRLIFAGAVVRDGRARVYLLAVLERASPYVRSHERRSRIRRKHIYDESFRRHQAVPTHSSG